MAAHQVVRPMVFAVGSRGGAEGPNMPPGYHAEDGLGGYGHLRGRKTGSEGVFTRSRKHPPWSRRGHVQSDF